MEGMTIINDRSSQTDNELGELKGILEKLEKSDKDKDVNSSPMNRENEISSTHMNRHHDNFQQNSHSGSSFTRFFRMDFPKFSGQELRTSLYKVDQIFAMEDIPSEQKVKVAAIHLEGEAIAWHRANVKHLNLSEYTSTEYVLALNERFGETFEDPMEELKSLNQTGTIKEYQASFDKLMTTVNLSKENAISCFIGGLKPEINKAVRMHNPKTLMQAYKAARLQEEVFEPQAKSWGLRTSGRQQARILPTPGFQKSANHHKIPPNRNTQNEGLNKPPMGRRLTSAEMDEKRAKGLCFFCDEKYVAGHKCANKKQIFLVDVTEEELVVEDEGTSCDSDSSLELEELMTISLQALMGVTGYQTIRVTGYHEKQPL
ncbi:unnamed protein product [Cuscuta campestris]|uniref:Ty3 transposon capsid-like protein domain-containing protein n=1 Tax=Cuscuta campestris TaxID=132261 RepID=A0A484MAQ1_9ASTE|nr:unnamed protein product [Cuscuta campestris]